MWLGLQDVWYSTRSSLQHDDLKCIHLNQWCLETEEELAEMHAATSGMFWVLKQLPK